MFIFIKRILLYVIILLVVIFIVLGVSSTARDYVFTRAMHSYNLYQLMSLRQDVRNRDFLSAKNKIESQVKISNKLSNSRGQGLVGIEDSLDFVIDKIMFNSQLDMFNPILEDLIKIDSNW